ncbi:DUF6544 family protein [uncultured Kordia sp.]|uniref:DUF6920 family protein n=1 Tax=uncultured Kordia sp. TaxID=507699 RepID=UPI002638978B|nr:DUF6544 family protein [uncultured Kordia sp.]
MYANYRFFDMTQKESKQLFVATKKAEKPIIKEAAIANLPSIVQKWLRTSGVINKEYISYVRLKQKGRMRTKPYGTWMSFNAHQYFNTSDISFVWTTKVKVFPSIYLNGRDKLVEGKGAMLIKLVSLIPVVIERENHQINAGAMIRYLAEICWFPSAALHDAISWETINKTSAKAILTIQNVSVSGIFRFSEEGKIISFEAQRFYGGAKEATLEKWCVEMVSYTEFNGIKIPNISNVIWKLNEGDFHWLTLEITDLEYNCNSLYE